MNSSKNSDLKSKEDELFRPLDDMEIPEPSNSIQESFNKKISRLESFEISNQPNRHFNIYLKVAAVAAVFLIGWFFGSVNNRNDKVLLQDVQKQLENNNRLLVLTLLQQPSTSDRLQATNLSFSLSNIDNQVVNALVNALKNDPDPNVKIKCAEVLATHLKPDSINQVFGDVLDSQIEPFIQLILIDYIKSTGNAESKRIVRNFINSGKADDFVKSEVKKSFNI